MKLTLGISTCPNDTYIFGPLLNGYVPCDFQFQTVMDDVEVLNKVALSGSLDIVKVSYGVVPQLLDQYCILKSGGALGFGCGPLLVSLNKDTVSDLKGKKIGVPGLNTSAFRIFKHFYGAEGFDFVEMRFDLIMPAILSGQLDAGIIIHEGRFTYDSFGLNKLCDLGELWEQHFNGPIPLGAIIVKKELAHHAKTLNHLIRASIQYSEFHLKNIQWFIKKYAQEMDDAVIEKHVALFVNSYSKDLSGAVEMLVAFLDCRKESFV